MKIAILGAGNVALANACWLSRTGHDVHVWSALENERADLTAAGKIDYSGIVEGAATVTVSPDAGSAVKDAAVVMIAAPAFAHKVLMQAAAPFLDDGQDVLVHPVTGSQLSVPMPRIEEPRQATYHRRSFNQPVHYTQIGAGVGASAAD
jgi:glycerol-3-phosphate dehydrogenase